MARNEYTLGQVNLQNRRGPGGGGGRYRVAEKPKDMMGTLKKLFAYFRKFLPMVIVAFSCTLVSVALTIFAPNMLSKITDLIEKGMKSGNMDLSLVYRTAVMILGFYLFSALLSFVEEQMMVVTSNRISWTLREDISHKLNRIPLSRFDSASFGDVLSRVTNDIDSVGMSLRMSANEIVNAAATFIGCGIMMLITNVWLALISMVFAFAGFFIMNFIIKKSQPYFSARSRNLGLMNGHIEEIYAGHLIVKAYNGEKDASEEFNRLNQMLYEANWKSQFISGIMRPLMTLLSNLGYVSVCVAGALMVLNGSISYGVIIAFVLYVRMFTMPLSMVAQAMTSLQTATAGAERIFAFLEEPELENEEHKIQKLEDVKGHISFEHVNFGYEPGHTIIHDFSYDVKPGQRVAIVGPTGAGKTTLVNLLMRFYELDGGAIKIDGISTRDMTREAVHDQFCMVLQDTWLFDGTVYENVAYSRPNVSREDVIEACKAVGMHRFIRSLPKGYDTVLSDATNLSAGQRQLLTIARAMIDDAKFLILDEATSSVDTRTEQLVQYAMDRLTEGRTSFTIAHRLSTIRNADVILVMKDGDIVETGNHEELLEKGGFYAELWNSQFVNAEAI